MQMRIKGPLLAVTAGFLCVKQTWAQKCPHDPVNTAELADQMESTKDPNVILRAAAIGGPALIPELRKLSIPETSAGTVGGAAQISLAKLGDEATYAELDVELNEHGPRYSVWALERLLMVNTHDRFLMILGYLEARPEPITLGCETDACYDYVPLIFESLADVVENAPIKIKDKYRPIGSIGDWVAWSKQEKPISFTISREFQDSSNALDGKSNGDSTWRWLTSALLVIGEPCRASRSTERWAIPSMDTSVRRGRPISFGCVTTLSKRR